MYGLDKQDFFEEVSLRAKNNFGPWNDEDGARSHVVTAIEDVINDFQVTLGSDYKEIESLVKEMTEDL